MNRSLPGHFDEVEGRSVGGADEVGAGDASRRSRRLHRATAVTSGSATTKSSPAGVLRDDVLDVWVHSNCSVRDERPRSRRPHQQVDTEVAQWAVVDREAHIHGGVDDVLIALRQLMVGQAGAAPWTVRGNTMVLDEQPAIGGSAAVPTTGCRRSRSSWSSRPGRCRPSSPCDESSARTPRRASGLTRGTWR